MNPATIQLTQLTGNGLSPAEQSAWPLTVQALGTGMPSEIFVYQIVPPTDQLPGDRFQCVASVSQLLELPLVARGHNEKIVPKPYRVAHKKPKKFPEFSIPYYRSSTAQFVCHTVIEAQDIWNMIQCATQRLVDNFNMCQTLQNTGTVLIGPSYVTPAQTLLPYFRLYPVNGQVVPQLLDSSTSLYHTLSIINDGGICTLQISNTTYPPIFTSSGTMPISVPGVPSLFRMFTIGSESVPQLLDTSTNLYHTLEILDDDGVITPQLSEQGYE